MSILLPAFLTGGIALFIWWYNRQPKALVRVKKSSEHLPIWVIGDESPRATFEVILIEIVNVHSVPISITSVTAEFDDGTTYDVADMGNGEVLPQSAKKSVKLSPDKLNGKTLLRVSAKDTTDTIWKSVKYPIK